MVDAKTKTESEENGQHVQRFYHETLWSYSNSRHATVDSVEASRFFLETTGVDFAGPVAFKITKKEQRKCYKLLFTCATSRAVH